MFIQILKSREECRFLQAIIALALLIFGPLPRVHALELDVGVVAISPSASAVYTTNETVQVTVKNFGPEAVNPGDFVVTYRVDNAAPVLQRFFAVPIPAGGQSVFAFTIPANLYLPGYHLIEATTIFPSDTDFSNNAFSVVVQSQVPPGGVAFLRDYDVGVTEVVSPSGSLAAGDLPVTVKVKNFGQRQLFGYEYTFQFQIDDREIMAGFNGVTLAPGEEKSVTLPGTAEVFPTGPHTIIASTRMGSDYYFSNDAAFGEFDISPLASSTVEITDLPYAEDFEDGESNWTAFAFKSSTPFALGTPTKTYLSGAASGSNAWVTDLSTNVGSQRALSQVISPIFDLSNVPMAEVSLNAAWESGPATEGARLEMSQDGGSTWEIVGASGEPNNWYNNGVMHGLEPFETGHGGWSGYFTAGSSPTAYDSSGGGGYSSSGTLGSNGYVPAKHAVQGGKKTKFRVIFGKPEGLADEGFAFDDFAVSAGAVVSQSVAFLTDVNSDGIADPGDTLRYTVNVVNSSSLDITNLSYLDLLTDTNLGLIVGSVDTDVGTIGSGNTSGNTTVSVNVGTLASGDTVTIHFNVTVGSLASSVEAVCAQGSVSSDQFVASTDDPNTVAAADAACKVAFGTSNLLGYDSSTFVEAAANDGSVDTVIHITLSEDTFVVTSGAMTPGVHYTVSNVPAGLTAVVTATSATTATLTLSGMATAHESSNDVSNLTLAFADDAFSTRPASKISNSTKSDFVVDFADAPTPTPSPTPTATPTASPTASQTPATTPTGPAATAEQLEGVIVDVNGRPVAGVLVYITVTNGQKVRKFSTLSDSTGRYLFKDLGEGTYLIDPEYTGFSFQPATVTLQPGSIAPRIVASAVTLNDAGCQSEDLASAINDSNAKSGNLLKFAQRRANAFSAAARRAKDAEAAHNLGKQSRNARLAHTELMGTAQQIPALTLSCAGKAGCTNQNLGELKAGYLNHLKRVHTAASKILDLGAQLLGEGAVAPYVKNGSRTYRLARAAAQKLPASTDVCR